MLDSVRMDIVLILTQDSCTVCAERTTGSAIILDAPKGDEDQVEARFRPECTIASEVILVHLEIVLVSLQDRCSVCTKHTVGSEIILDAPDSTPR
jgi:hypothetical protein